MSAEDRRQLSAEMMARIDRIVSGHEQQRSPEAAPRYIGRVDDGPLRFEDEHEQALITRGTITTRLSVHHLDGNPRNNAIENLAFVDPRENSGVGIRGARCDLVIFDEISEPGDTDDGGWEPHRSFVPSEIVDFVAPGSVTVTLPDAPLSWTIDEDGHFYGYAAEGAPTAPVAPDTASYEPFGARLAPESRATFTMGEEPA